MLLLAKFKKILFMGFRATLNFRKYTDVILKREILPDQCFVSTRTSMSTRC